VVVDIDAYQHQFKVRVIRQLVRIQYPKARYSPSDGIDVATFRSSRLFHSEVDRYHAEDLVEGRCGTTRFRISEVHAEHMTTSMDTRGGTRTQWHTIFRGTICFADFHKHFRGFTLVLPDTAERLLGHLGQQLQGVAAGGTGWQLVALEDVEFERAFVVYGTDQVEARYILSLSLMQRLLDLRRRLGGDLRVAFVDDQVVVAVAHVTNRFEPPSVWRSEPVLVPHDVEVYLAQIRLAADIVEGLDLDTRIWSKQ
jgi:hypothetical protein